MLEYKPIKSLRRIKKTCKVYNFSVPRCETYIANGFVVHNCQNFLVSQSTNTSNTKYQSPQDLIKRAKKANVRGFAFTYNEPTIHQDYIMDLGHELTVKQLPFDIVLKTNGFANKPVLRNLSLFVSAMNVDIKGDKEEYQRTCGGTLAPVMDAVEWISTLKVHLEISYLVLPRQVNDLQYHRRMRDWLVSISSNIPIHILYFYPFHKMTDATYRPKDLLQVIDVFKVKMKNVYVSNVFSKGMIHNRNTICSECSDVLIDRSLSKVVVHKTECCDKKISSLLVESETE